MKEMTEKTSLKKSTILTYIYIYIYMYMYIVNITQRKGCFNGYYVICPRK